MTTTITEQEMLHALADAKLPVFYPIKVHKTRHKCKYCHRGNVDFVVYTTKRGVGLHLECVPQRNSAA